MKNIKKQSYKNGDSYILILSSAKGIAVFEYRNLMWRLTSFRLFGVGIEDVTITNDGASRILSLEEKDLLNKFYQKFDRYFTYWRLVNFRKVARASYLDVDQRNSLFATPAPVKKSYSQPSVLRAART
jgi:hypothetical protein